ncbi:hypothetical protein FVEG_15755 [Fusarium verticillioides 7600]|uniref:Protein NO VEIN C-terminal domain-containing protein n=1 Tax=Gibberella moniliformis (strain M3125 / FGSC 7600) TaxID=334819 RepID=W7MBJ6_GIBM7|nr:hypothetical protein FVEG_15755 [Fusarium verticillioides 7600]EWG44919.1 hypothetical protein FVEG_15755 [Fusarium verticillioides 7600]
MGSIATTKAEADAHLETLRQKRGVGRGQQEDVSDQLYKASTHFILELIQNADDNQYGSEIVPSLRLALYKNEGQGYFRSDCNEVGFTFKQLDALTRVGQSTKATSIHDSKSYIGEKGIGFKSVFKVADVIHVASGLYEFKFDRNTRIGMILPITSQFPTADRVVDHTQFLLELKSQRDYDIIKKELNSIEPDLLLFLRNLHQVHISTYGSNKVYRRKTTKFDARYKGEAVEISVQSDDITSKELIVHRHVVEKLPPEPQREGVVSSEVVLAFIVDSEANPVANTQKVFAFLPVDDFGFRFLIHADFILVANREGLNESSLWNWSLRDEIQTAFVDAIHRLVSLSPTRDGEGLCYKWPKYLPRYHGTSGFWYGLHENMMNALRDTPLLRSRAGGTLRMPTDLYYVPERYRFENGTVFDLPSLSRSHLSFEYDSVKSELSLIGVKTLNNNDLWRELSQWINEVGVDGLKAQSVKWHQKVSSIFCDQQKLREKLRDLPIVPLRDGSWVRARQDRVFFTSTHTQEHVPTGIELSLVDNSVSQDSERRRFLSFLGIREYSPAQVCGLIIKLHHDLPPGPCRTEMDLVTDALYLFDHQSCTNYEVPNIHFVAIEGGKTVRTRKRHLYLVDPDVKPGLIAKYQYNASSPLMVLSSKYEVELCKDRPRQEAELFRRWLLGSRYREFSTVPTLLHNNELSAEWHFLRSHDVMDLLQAIRLQWDRKGMLSPIIIKAAAELQVPGSDGRCRPLGRLAILTPELKQKCPHLDFVSLPDPECNWEFLSILGVLTTCNTAATLRELQKLAQLQTDEVDKDAVRKIYEKLNASMQSEWKQISTVFREQPLVLVQKPEPRWLDHLSCVWDAPGALKQVTRLRNRYPTCRQLFISILGVRQASTEDIVEELCSVSDEGDLVVQRFSELFFLLKEYVVDHEELSKDQVRRIRQAAVFPIVVEGGSSDEHPRITRQSICEGNWYVPDEVHLEQAFRCRVAMLSMRVKDVKTLHELFENLDCKQMFLSCAVGQSTELKGTCIRDLRREGDLMIRLDYLAMAFDQPTLFEDIMVQTWSVSSILTKSRLGDVEISEDKLISIKNDDEGVTNIYIREDIAMTEKCRDDLVLLEHFIGNDGIFEVDAEEAKLFTLFLTEPFAQLSGILEMCNIEVPDSPGNGDTGNQQNDHEDQESDGEDKVATIIHPATAYSVSDSDREEMTESGSESQLIDLAREFGNLRISSSPCGNDTNFITPASSPRLVPEHEVITSNNPTSQGTIQRPTVFHADETPVARTPRSTTQLRGVLDQHVPTQAAEITSGSDLSLPLYSPLVPASYQNILGSNSPRHENSPRALGVPSNRYREIGFLGESFVYRMIQPHIKDWTYENWTSKLRVEAGHPRFTEREKDFSDFTYQDRFGQMKILLQEAGVDVVAGWSHDTTFHLEVKATLGPCSEPCFVSQNQLDKMRQYEGDLANVYILIRVFQMEAEGGPDFRLFVNPWSLYLTGALEFRSSEGYKVYGLM